MLIWYHRTRKKPNTGLIPAFAGMTKNMPIYTRKGDAGANQPQPLYLKPLKLFANEALGEIDELQAWLGCAKCIKIKDLSRALYKIQSTLFRVMAHVGRDNREKVAVPILSNDHVKELEAMIVYFEKITAHDQIHYERQFHAWCALQ